MTTNTVPPNLIRAQGAAWKLTKKFGFKHPREICLEDIAMERNVLVASGSIEGCEARLTRKGKYGIIRVRAAVNETGRRRFSISHELGHWEQHDSSQWYACSASDLRDYKTNPIEVEANTFAAELLMPTAMMRPRCEKPAPTLQLSKDIAGEFDVSLTAASIRLLHLTRHECVLVASKNRQISWWIPKTDRFGVWLRKGQTILPESLAWHAAIEDANEEVVEVVPADAWFPNRPSNTEFVVCEQSMLLRNYNTVLTLLTFEDSED